MCGGTIGKIKLKDLDAIVIRNAFLFVIPHPYGIGALARTGIRIDRHSDSGRLVLRNAEPLPIDIAPDAVMLRAEWIYDVYEQRPNYLMLIRDAATLAFSSRQYRGITYVKEVAENLDAVTRLPGGVYNFGSETTLSMYEITKRFLALIGKNTPLDDAPPRHNLWMNCDKATRRGVIFSSVENALVRCAADYGWIT